MSEAVTTKPGYLGYCESGVSWKMALDLFLSFYGDQRSASGFLRVGEEHAQSISRSVGCLRESPRRCFVSAEELLASYGSDVSVLEVLRGLACSESREEKNSIARTARQKESSCVVLVGSLLSGEVGGADNCRLLVTASFPEVPLTYERLKAICRGFSGLGKKRLIVDDQLIEINLSDPDCFTVALEPRKQGSFGLESHKTSEHCATDIHLVVASLRVDVQQSSRVRSRIAEELERVVEAGVPFARVYIERLSREGNSRWQVLASFKAGESGLISNTGSDIPLKQPFGHEELDGECYVHHWLRSLKMRCVKQARAELVKEPTRQLEALLKRYATLPYEQIVLGQKVGELTRSQMLFLSLVRVLFKCSRDDLVLIDCSSVSDSQEGQSFYREVADYLCLRGASTVLFSERPYDVGVLESENDGSVVGVAICHEWEDCRLAGARFRQELLERAPAVCVDILNVESSAPCETVALVSNSQGGNLILIDGGDREKRERYVLDLVALLGGADLLNRKVQFLGLTEVLSYKLPYGGKKKKLVRDLCGLGSLLIEQCSLVGGHRLQFCPLCRGSAVLRYQRQGAGAPDVSWLDRTYIGSGQGIARSPIIGKLWLERACPNCRATGLTSLSGKESREFDRSVFSATIEQVTRYVSAFGPGSTNRLNSTLRDLVRLGCAEVKLTEPLVNLNLTDLASLTFEHLMRNGAPSRCLKVVSGVMELLNPPQVSAASLIATTHCKRGGKLVVVL